MTSKKDVNAEEFIKDIENASVNVKHIPVYHGVKIGDATFLVDIPYYRPENTPSSVYESNIDSDEYQLLIMSINTIGVINSHHGIILR